MNNLVFSDINVNKNFFYESKQGIKLNDIIIKNIVVSNKIKINDKIIKYCIGHIIDDKVIPLTLLLPNMSGWIKYFENGKKNMSFRIEDDEVFFKYNNIWNKIKDLLNGIRLNSDVTYNDKYIKTKVKDNKSSVTNFSNNIIPQEQTEYICITCITIDSILKIEKKYYPQVYLEQCKYKEKVRKIKNLIDYDLLESDSDLE